MTRLFPPSIPVRAWSALWDIFRTEAAGGIVLISAAVLALVVANSPLADGYLRLLHLLLGPLSLLHWINDGLMAIFFLLVGLELKRELLDGALSTRERRLLPGAAALAGMVVPALLYLGVNGREAAAARGWAIPAATDIAFALGVLALLGPRVPASLKVLLTAIAVIDDLGAIVVIGLFYTAAVAVVPLAIAGGVLLVLLTLNRLRVRALWPYLLLGVGLWASILASGVHATLAGVATAAFVPLDATAGQGANPRSPLHRLEHALHPIVAFGIVPLFGLANAGVNLGGLAPAALARPVPLGIVLGLVLGKQLGVFGACWALVRIGVADLPAGASWRQVYGMAVVCGVGFTMSLFIGGLAFGDEGPAMEAVKLGVLAGSVLSAAAACLVLYAGSRSGRSV